MRNAVVSGVFILRFLLLQDPMAKLGRLTFPTALFAYPFYLWNRSPGKQGSHYDPNSDLFQPGEANMVRHLPHLQFLLNQLVLQVYK